MCINNTWNSKMPVQNLDSKELYRQYNWFYENFATVLQEAGDDFFTPYFEIKFIGLSKNVNYLLNKESCFVSKIQIQKDYDIFFRLTEKAVDLILNKALGKSKNRFSLNNISEIETKIITAFNNNIYNNLKSKLANHDPKELKRTNFDNINLAFIIKDLDENVKECGKIFVTIPQALLHAQEINSTNEKFSKDDFNKSEIKVNINVGNMNFPLYDVKNLDIEDVVVFENSRIDYMKLFVNNEEIDININPNMKLLISDEGSEEGDGKMAETHNIWDSIEVEMNAEFDSVKITLKELKDIEDGLVVDLASLYDNNVTLKVEGKPVASGNLVIVNDRYGVKINKVYAGANAQQINNSEQNEENNEQNFEQQEEIINPEEENPQDQSFEQEEEAPQPEEGEGEEDFDYSDFDLEDENI